MDPISEAVLDAVKYLQIKCRNDAIYPTDAWGFVHFECHPHTVRRRMNKLVDSGILKRISYMGGYVLAQPESVSREELREIDRRIWTGSAVLVAA